MRETIPITQDQQSDLNAWRATALERMPYMATILLHLRPLNAPGLGTFACDRHLRLYVDFDAVTAWGVTTCAEALLHECFHIFADDARRSDEFGVTPERHPQWNIASDAANNDDLVEAGCISLKEIGAILPDQLGQPDHQTAEFYMRAIMDQQPPPSGGDGSDPDFTGCGSASGGESAPCELDPDDDANGAAPAATAAERKIVDVATATDVREYAGKHPGTVPGGITEIAERILAPSEVPWRVVLASAIRRAAAMRAGDYDTTYGRRNRRRSTVDLGGGRRAVQPGIYSPTPTLVVVRDTSGSMTDASLGMVTSEVDGIARQLGIRGTDLMVLDVDVKVNAAREYRSASDLDEASGRGGTDMTMGIDAAMTMRPKPGAIVVITDGYTPMPKERTSTPVVFCVVGPGSGDPDVLKSIPDWIRVVKVAGPGASS